MRYNFKVDLYKVYKYFLEDESLLDISYLNELDNEYDYFKIKYDTDITNDKLNLINQLEGLTDNQQILLLGIKEDKEYVLCYYFVGSEEDIMTDTDRKEYEEAIKCFNKILECKIRQ